MINMSFEFPDLMAKLKKHEKELYLSVAATMQTNRGLLFDAEGAYNGHQKWAPLKFRVGQILSKRGNLRKSIAPMSQDGRPGPGGIVRFGGDVVTIGTNLIMAKLMNDGTVGLPGGVLRPKKAKALKIPVPGGKGATEGAKDLRKSGTKIDNEVFIFRKSVRIPARPFDKWSSEDQSEMEATLMNKIAEVLNRG